MRSSASLHSAGAIYCCYETRHGYVISAVDVKVVSDRVDQKKQPCFYDD